LSEVKDVLVAGCGTGLHPIGLALTMNVSVTAIDITKRSLGYASMKSDELKAENIKFYHMDLMEVGLLNKQYDAVECSGVLHHMDDPESGLKALLGVVKPGGYIKLGLYSELARRAIVEVRKAFVRSEMKPSLENIRAIRTALLYGDAKPECKQVVRFGDFYASSPCRDLLFHAQEHRYTIETLRQLLERNNLTFMGMIVSDKNVRASFNSLYGESANSDLNKWEEFERYLPDTFSNMYQFLVKVPESTQ
jgi:ubiquinone/menaquinone biosynthesis C-methylase UbiE